MKKMVLLAIMFLFAPACFAVTNFELSDQGTSVLYSSNGSVLSSGDLDVYVIDAPTGGNTLYHGFFPGAIVNGGWNVMLGANPINPLVLNYSQEYWKDYAINGEDVSFINFSGGVDARQEFYSPMGDIYTPVYWSALTGVPFNCNASQAVHYNGSWGCIDLAAGGIGPQGPQGLNGSNSNVSCQNNFLECDYSVPLITGVLWNLTAGDARYLNVSWLVANSPVYNNLTLSDVVVGVGNWTADKVNYTTTENLPVYNNGSSNLTLAQVASSVGNWSNDKSSYTTTADLPVYNNLTLSQVASSVGNWSADSVNYTPTANLPVYNNGTSNLTLAQISASIGNWTADKVNYTPTANLPVYNNGTSNLTLVQVAASVGNWSGNASSYVPYTGATSDVNLGTHNLTVSNITLGNGYGIFSNATCTVIGPNFSAGLAVGTRC